jgi:hypothetical protein
MEGILMKQLRSRLMALALVLVLGLTLCVPAMAADKAALESKVTESAAYMLEACRLSIIRIITPQ